MALSTVEVEYIAAGACCAQILYMKQTLLDYGVVLEKVPLLCDNESAVKLANNPVQHSPVSLCARPHPISTYGKTINIYLSAIFRTDKSFWRDPARDWYSCGIEKSEFIMEWL